MADDGRVLLVNSAEEEERYLKAVAQILREVQADHETTLLEISKKTGIGLKTVSNAANEKAVLNPLYLKRLGQVYGPHTLDPYMRLCGGRAVAREHDGASDILPVLIRAASRVAEARTVESPGGVVETLSEQLGYLPDLRLLRRVTDSTIAAIEKRKDAA